MHRSTQGYTEVHRGTLGPLPPMHEPRRELACAAIGGCVIVAGGVDPTAAIINGERVDVIADVWNMMIMRQTYFQTYMCVWRRDIEYGAPTVERY